jgi:hypothetical protein
VVGRQITLPLRRVSAQARRVEATIGAVERILQV